MSEAATALEAPPKGKSKLPLVLAVVLLAGGGGAAAVFGPKLLGGGAAAAHGEEAAEPAAEHDEGEEEGSSPAAGDPPGGDGHGPGSPALEPIVVDVLAADGEVHHLKVHVTVELRGHTKPEEFARFVPRTREAVTAYLRSLTFEQVVDRAKYAEIRQEISKAVLKAAGKQRVSRVLVTDFVTQ
ncbi:MAG: flagellar basal body-associated FliL family protein [Polyangiaceae bacterium]|nr:flagellar basal body-associated FliL family protein [Polyangiaceae bacterium]